MIFYLKPDKFNSEYSFFVNDKKQSAGSNISNILGLGQNDINQQYHEILKSKLLFEEFIFEDFEVDGHKTNLGQYYIDSENLQEKWRNSKDSLEIKWSKIDLNKFIQSGDPQEIAQLKDYLFKILMDVKMLNINFDKNSSIFTLNYFYKDEFFCFNFSKKLMEKFEIFIKDQNSDNLNLPVNALKNKLDSINRELNFYVNRLAKENDNSLGLVLSSDKIRQKKYEMKIQILTQMYTEGLKQYETYSTIQNSSDIKLLILYSPVLPLENEKFSFIIYLLLSLFLGSFCFYTFFRFKKIVSES